MQHAFPIVEILLSERHVEAVGVAGGLDVAGGCAFSQHLLDGIAGDEVDQEKNGRDDEPDDGQRVEQAGKDLAQHRVRMLGTL